MFVIVMRPGAPAVVEEHPDTLKALQALVGGWIEPLPEPVLGVPHEAYVNEEGLLQGLPENRGYAGTIVVCGPEESRWTEPQAKAAHADLLEP